MTDFSKDDIRAAVASGVLSEAQAANVLTIAQARQGSRDNMPADDEPFEFFNGFSEIFITVGLTLLITGIVAGILIAGTNVIASVLGLALCWLLAIYFTRKRRMSLPSIGLAIGFGAFVIVAYMSIVLQSVDDFTAVHGLFIGLTGMVAMSAYFYFFRLPFAAFVVGLFGIGAITSIAAIGAGNEYLYQMRNPFDLSSGSTYAYASLVFGIIAFVGGMYFDTKDPHRIGRYSATGFWLHILAAPALVNTIAITALSIDGWLGYAVTSFILVVVCLLALIIDRRSFLTAGIGYLGAVMLWAFGGSSEVSGISMLILLGIFVTALGTWWTPLRARIMSALPDHTFKTRLPPYTEPS
jgi:hypothetical protein